MVIVVYSGDDGYARTIAAALRRAGDVRTHQIGELEALAHILSAEPVDGVVADGDAGEVLALLQERGLSCPVFVVRRDAAPAEESPSVRGQFRADVPLSIVSRRIVTALVTGAAPTLERRGPPSTEEMLRRPSTASVAGARPLRGGPVVGVLGDETAIDAGRAGLAGTARWTSCADADELASALRYLDAVVAVLDDEAAVRALLEVLPDLRAVGDLPALVVPRLGSPSMRVLDGVAYEGLRFLAADEALPVGLAALVQRAEERATNRAPRILVVGEAPAALLEGVAALRGRSITSARADAEHAVRESGPDLLVIVDDEDPVGLVATLRRASGAPRTPSVLVAATNRAHRSELLEKGFDDVLSPHASMAEVLRRIGAVLSAGLLARQQAYRDDLTGLRHATALPTEIGRALGRTRTAFPFSVVLFDIDEFTRVEEEYGEMAARTVLRATADHLTALFEGRGVVYRGRRDEFFVLADPAFDEVERRQLLKSVQEVGRITFRSADGRGFYATLTGGHVVVPQVEVLPDEIIAKAFLALDAARRAGSAHVLTAELDPQIYAKKPE